MATDIDTVQLQFQWVSLMSIIFHLGLMVTLLAGCCRKRNKEDPDQDRKAGGVQEVNIAGASSSTPNVVVQTASAPTTPAAAPHPSVEPSEPKSEEKNVNSIVKTPPQQQRIQAVAQYQQPAVQVVPRVQVTTPPVVVVSQPYYGAGYYGGYYGAGYGYGGGLGYCHRPLYGFHLGGFGGHCHTLF